MEEEDTLDIKLMPERQGFVKANPQEQEFDDVAQDFKEKLQGETKDSMNEIRDKPYNSVSRAAIKQSKKDCCEIL